jgi:hypothetical protein
MTPASQRAKDLTEAIWQCVIFNKGSIYQLLTTALLEWERATTTKYREEIAKELALDHDMLSKNKWTTSQIIAALDRIDMREAQAKEGG